MPLREPRERDVGTPQRQQAVNEPSIADRNHLEAVEDRGERSPLLGCLRVMSVVAVGQWPRRRNRLQPAQPRGRAVGHEPL